MSVRAASFCALFFSLAALTSCASLTRGEFAIEYYMLAQGYADQKNYTKAAEYYKRAAAHSSTAAAASYELARVYALSGDYAAAADCLEELLKKDGENGMLLSAYAYVLAMMERYNDSIEVYRLLRARNVFDNKTAANYASLLFTAGLYEESLETVQNARRMYPDDAALRKLYVLAALKTDADGAEKTAVDFLTLNENASDDAVLSALAAYYVERELYYKALPLYERLSGDYKTPQTLFETAEIYFLKTNEYDNGIARLDEALAKGFKDKERLDGLIAALPEEKQYAVRELALKYREPPKEPPEPEYPALPPPFDEVNGAGESSQAEESEIPFDPFDENAISAADDF